MISSKELFGLSFKYYLIAKSIVAAILDLEICPLKGSNNGNAIDLTPKLAANCKQLIMHS